MSGPSVIEEIFLAALEKGTAAERAAFLDVACKDDPDLRGHVARLLNAHPKAEKFLEPAERPNDDMAATYVPVSERAGAIIAGRYKLLEQIGEGGMGSVWVAEQQQPVKRKVAIKLIKAGMDSKQVLARFEAERQALAVMDHPNISKVFDGGLTDQGRPFFVMEYVKGVPFTEYCDKARLSLKERLTLFISVCQAVQHAHQKGIVHRDLKPSNILICLYDGKPVPKVIDFGLAKAMHQSLTDQSIYTGHGVMVGTPLYMSPEQAEQNNLDVDTRTDIYSLGVVLYELLTGTTPLEREHLRHAAYAEIVRLIKEVEAPRPSTRLSGSVTLPGIAAQRNIDPKHLQRSLSGDLDWIVMKSLEKERSRRYETTSGLARDIERFLNNEAVEACPPNQLYRLKKYVGRHKSQVVAGALVLSALLIAIVSLSWGLQRSNAAADAVKKSLAEVTQERDAKNRALEGQAVALKEAQSQFVNGILHSIGHGKEPGRAELRAFLDWSSIADQRLRLSVLEMGLNDPDTALRIALRAERCAQSCIGLNPRRREDALRIIRAVQSNPLSSSASRAAGSWFAIELGAGELADIPSMLTYLAVRDEKLWSGVEDDTYLEQFGLYALRRAAPLADAPRSGLRKVLAAIRREKAENGVNSALNCIVAAMPNAFTSAEAREEAEEQLQFLTSIRIKPSWETEFVARAKYGCTAVVRLLPRVLHDQRFPSICSRLYYMSPEVSSSLGLVVSIQTESSRLPRETQIAILASLFEQNPERIAYDSRFAISVAGMFNQMNNEQRLIVSNTLMSLATVQDIDTPMAIIAIDTLIRLKSRLTPSNRNRLSEELLEQLSDYSSHSVHHAALGISAMEPIFTKEQADRLAMFVEEGLRSRQLSDSMLESLISVCTRNCGAMSPVRARAVWHELVAAQKVSSFNDTITLLNGAWPIASLLSNMDVADSVDLACKRLEAMAGEYQAEFRPAATFLISSSPVMAEEQFDRAAALLISRIHIETYWEDLAIACRGLSLMNRRLDARQANVAREALLAIVNDPQKTFGSVPLHYACDCLVSLSDRSSEDECLAVFRAFLLLKGEDCVLAEATHLATQMSGRSGMAIFDAIMLAYLDENACYDSESWRSWPPDVIPCIQQLTSGESIANLLSHPACVDPARDELLQRFEELIFHDGRHVFLTYAESESLTSTSDSSVWQPKPEPPPRRFQTIAAAAKWIKLNRPDLDLEATTPVTWHE